MNNSNRERLLLSLLPALLLVIVWYGWKRNSFVRQRDGAAKALASVQAAAPDPAQIAAARSARRELSERDARGNRERDELLARWSDLRQDLEPVREPAQVIEQVVRLLEHHELNVLQQRLAPENSGNIGRGFTRFADQVRNPHEWESSPVSGSPAAKAAALRDTSAAAPAPPRTVSGSTAARQHTIWRIDLTGSYRSMQDAMAALARDLPHETVVQLTMAEADPQLTLRSWTLYLAM